jgi:hypothetical protein
MTKVMAGMSELRQELAQADAALRSARRELLAGPSSRSGRTQSHATTEAEIMLQNEAETHAAADEDSRAAMDAHRRLTECQSSGASWRARDEQP